MLQTYKQLGLGAVIISLCLPALTQAQTPHEPPAPALDTSVCAPDGIALGGYDVVSYHQQAAPSLGSQEYSAQHEGLHYLFASQNSLQAFVAAPGKYLPNYRGWCSTNLSMGRLACPDYTNYKIENGKLLLFERVGFTNGRDVWDSDPLIHRNQADSNLARLSAHQ